MKKLNRFVTLLAAAVLAFGVIGCKSEEDDPVPVTGIEIGELEYISLNNECVVPVKIIPANADNKGYTLYAFKPGTEDPANWVIINNNKIKVTAGSADSALIDVPASGRIDAAKFDVVAVSNEKGFKASRTLNVDVLELKSIKLKSSASVYINRTAEIPVEFTPSDASFKDLIWSIDDKTVLESAGGNNFKGLKIGSSKVTAKSAKNSALTSDCTIEVKPVMPDRLSLKMSSYVVQKGGSCVLVPVFTPADTTNKGITMSCSADGVGLNNDGTITISESFTGNSATITVVSAADSTKRVTATINVIAAGAYIIDENQKDRGFVSAVISNGTAAVAKTNNLAENSWSGDGYLDSLGTGNVLYSICSPVEQTVKVSLRYAYWGTKTATRVAAVYVNGIADDELLYCNWTNKKLDDTNEISINLLKGENQIRVESLPKGTAVHIKEGDEPGAVYPEGTTGDGVADGNLPNIDYIKFVVADSSKSLGAGANSLSFSKVTAIADVAKFGSVELSPQQNFYVSGSTVKVTAVPAAGYEFDSWIGNPDTTGSFNVVVNEDLAFVAHFKPTGYVNEGLEGYATVSDDAGSKYTVTGGAGGKTITISTLADLTTYKSQISGSDPYIINVTARINTGSNKSTTFDIGSNKTVIGEAGKDYGFKNINPKISGTNIIIKNLHFGDVIGDDLYGGSGNDALSIKGGQHVWIDHCEFSSSLVPKDNDGNIIKFADYKKAGGVVDLEGENTTEEEKWAKDFYDGLLDISETSRFVSVSNSYFHDHWKACLCGGSNDKAETKPQGSQVRMTFYNNHFKNIHARQPLFRFGKAHIFNTYLEGVSDGTSTGIEVRAESQVYVDHCYFEKIRDGRRVGCWNSSSGLGQGTWTVLACFGEGDINGAGFVPPYGWTPMTAEECKTNLPPTAGNK